MTVAKALFQDTGLMLAVLDALMRDGVLDQTAIEETLAGIAGNDYGLDPEAETIDIERERAREAVARLADLDVNEADLRKIQRIDFDGGNDIYMSLEEAIEIDTGGEESWYELKSLAGIGALTSLRRLDLNGHGYRDAALDLTPLESHPTLEEVDLTGECTGAAALETLSKLDSVGVGSAKLDAPDVLDRLAARGVTVRR